MCDLCLVQNSTEEEEEEGVSRVRVTSRRSPQKVERVCGLVSRSHIETPKVGGDAAQDWAVGGQKEATEERERER